MFDKLLFYSLFRMFGTVGIFFAKTEGESFILRRVGTFTVHIFTLLNCLNDNEYIFRVLLEKIPLFDVIFFVGKIIYFPTSNLIKNFLNSSNPI